MNDTTQEEFPPLPHADFACANQSSGGKWNDMYSADNMRDYARECIATLKAENERLRAAIADARDKAPLLKEGV